MTTVPDHDARERIRLATDETLFVEAGAGSGKTASLVDRVTTLVLRDDVPIERIAAVTFTEKAGSELRDKLRARFQQRLRSTDDSERRRIQAALDGLDAAAIGTLHSFAQRILTLHAIEAGLPPLIEVMDEVASSVAADARWSVLQRQLLDDPDVADLVVTALAIGVKLPQLRSLAKAFGNDWDLIEDRVLVAPRPAPQLPDATLVVMRALDVAKLADQCSTDDDKLLALLDGIRSAVERLRPIDDPADQYAVLRELADLKTGRTGQGRNWPDIATVRGAVTGLAAEAESVADGFIEAMLRPLAYWVARRVHESALERARTGRLEFHDLLVMARAVLRKRPEVRAALQRRYPRLLLDEFQDTDPIQIELALRIAGGADADAADLDDLAVPGGSIFVVGDPKQSIYRFRRASIAVYLRTQAGLGHTVLLSTNFRSAAPVVDWINGVFFSMIAFAPDAQPAYEPLLAYRGTPSLGPPVAVVGTEAHVDKPTADTLRRREAADVAAAIRTALAEGWTVRGGDNEERSIRHGDIAILLPSRTSLAALEDALDAARIPYRAESSSLVYQAAEVRDLMAAARAVADPSDALALVTALRSPLFGCGDDDLWTWKLGDGRFNLLAPVPEGLDAHPVARAVDYLRSLHHKVRWLPPSAVLGLIVADRRMLEVSAVHPRARDQWRRLRFVVDQARAWSEVEHGGLRAYLAWAARQGEDSSRATEAILPETDVDAVRIMTIHGAKGLEFPMVVLSGMSTEPRQPTGVRLIWTADGFAVKLSSQVQTNDFEKQVPIEEQMDAYERRRLLYVAATRAKDHLVVSLHRKDGHQQTAADLFVEHGASRLAPALDLSGAAFSPEWDVATAVDPPPDWDDWLAFIEQARRVSQRAAAITASGLEGTEPEILLAPVDEVEAGLAKGARNVELPPWSKGRYGTAVGRAVHGVLQAVDLRTGEGLEGAVKSMCIAEDVVGYADVVHQLAQSALDSDLVKRAAVRPRWRESWAGTVQEDGTVLEGIVDLIYREDDGSLVIIDYKTDAVPGPALASRVARYRPQLLAYRDMLQDADSTAVKTCLLFLHPAGSIEQWL